MQSSGLRGGQIFQAVYRQVDAPLEQGAFDLHHEHAIATDGGKRQGGVAITQGANLLYLNVQVGPLLMQPRDDRLRL